MKGYSFLFNKLPSLREGFQAFVPSRNARFPGNLPKVSCIKDIGHFMNQSAT